MIANSLNLLTVPYEKGENYIQKWTVYHGGASIPIQVFKNGMSVCCENNNYLKLLMCNTLYIHLVVQLHCAQIKTRKFDVSRSMHNSPLSPSSTCIKQNERLLCCRIFTSHVYFGNKYAVESHLKEP